MNHPPPSDRTYVTGAPASPDFWILTSGFFPNIRNEPNLPSRHHPVGFTVSKECETNPIYRTAGVSPASPAPNIRNEPNPAPILHGVPLQRRIGAGNEPNCHPRVASRAPGCGAKRSGPKSRDLFNHHRQRRFQTNKPTPTTQKMRNEPNPGTRSVPPPPISTKRTQFHPQRTCGRPKNTKRTQFQTTNIHSTIYNIQSLGPNPPNSLPSKHLHQYGPITCQNTQTKYRPRYSMSFFTCTCPANTCRIPHLLLDFPKTYIKFCI